MSTPNFDLEAVRKRLDDDPTADSENANDLDDALLEIERLRAPSPEYVASYIHALATDDERERFIKTMRVASDFCWKCGREGELRGGAYCHCTNDE